MFKLNKNSMLVGIAVLAVIVTGVLLLANSSSYNVLSFLKFSPTMSKDQVAKKSLEYLNGTVLQGRTATLVSVSEESGVLKLKISIDGASYDSYATKDGKLFFPEAFALDADTLKQNNQGTVDITKVKITGQPSYGDANAPVVIAEWADYQCPFCKKMEQEVMSIVMQDYVKTGKVRIVYKDYAFLGADSQTVALAARAVWEAAPDKFHDWHEAVYDKQDAENSGWGSRIDILALTKSLGIDSNKVGQLMTSKTGEYQKAIDADKAEGTAFGVNGTPAFIIGTQLISGFTPYATLKGAIDTLLAGK